MRPETSRKTAIKIIAPMKATRMLVQFPSVQS